MARHYIGINTTGPRVLRNVHRDITGEPLVYLDQDAVTTLRLNLSDWLETGETVSSASVTAEGVTASVSTSSPNVDVTLSAANSGGAGKITVTVTSSTAQVWRGIVWVRRTSRYGDEQSFRDYS